MTTDRTRISRIMEKLEALWYDKPEWSFIELLEEGLSLQTFNLKNVSKIPTDIMIKARLDRWMKTIAGV